MDGWGCWGVGWGGKRWELWTERTGRLGLNSMISFMRTPKICEVTPSAASDSRNTAMGAILAGVIFLERSRRAFCASVSAGKGGTLLLPAGGEMDLGPRGYARTARGARRPSTLEAAICPPACSCA